MMGSFITLPVGTAEIRTSVQNSEATHDGGWGSQRSEI